MNLLEALQICSEQGHDPSPPLPDQDRQQWYETRTWRLEKAPEGCFEPSQAKVLCARCNLYYGVTLYLVHPIRHVHAPMGGRAPGDIEIAPGLSMNPVVGGQNPRVTQGIARDATNRPPGITVED